MKQSKEEADLNYTEMPLSELKVKRSERITGYPSIKRQNFTQDGEKRLPTLEALHSNCLRHMRGAVCTRWKAPGHLKAEVDSPTEAVCVAMMSRPCNILPEASGIEKIACIRLPDDHVPSFIHFQFIISLACSSRKLGLDARD